MEQVADLEAALNDPAIRDEAGDALRNPTAGAAWAVTYRLLK
jgi:hypothetical protein